MCAKERTLEGLCILSRSTHWETSKLISFDVIYMCDIGPCLYLSYLEPCIAKPLVYDLNIGDKQCYVQYRTGFSVDNDYWDIKAIIKSRDWCYFSVYFIYIYHRLRMKNCFFKDKNINLKQSRGAWISS